MSGDTNQRETDARLFAALAAFARQHEDSNVSRFADAFDGADAEWTDVGRAHLPASDILAAAESLSADATSDIVSQFCAARRNLKWEQSYKKSDDVVGDEMLAGYGFAEIVGKWGPFVSERVRAGIGVWGPGIDYPVHRHEPEEAYVIAAGSATFTVGDAAPSVCHAGETVHVPSLTPHGFATTDQPVVVLYYWRGGDLRRTSSFGAGA